MSILHRSHGERNNIILTSVSLNFLDNATLDPHSSYYWVCDTSVKNFLQVPKNVILKRCNNMQLLFQLVWINITIVECYKLGISLNKNVQSLRFWNSLQSAYQEFVFYFTLFIKKLHPWHYYKRIFHSHTYIPPYHIIIMQE